VLSLSSFSLEEWSFRKQPRTINFRNQAVPFSFLITSWYLLTLLSNYNNNLKESIYVSNSGIYFPMHCISSFIKIIKYIKIIFHTFTRRQRLYPSGLIKSIRLRLTLCVMSLLFRLMWGLSWSWSNGSWISNCMYNQGLSPLMFWVQPRSGEVYSIQQCLYSSDWCFDCYKEKE
jgi:hypothetical protein